MPGSWPIHELPNLNDNNCRETSRAVRRYNCIAWAAGDNTQNWWPDPSGWGYWPPGVPRAETIPAFIAAYETLGYKLCFDERLEDGTEKVAIFGLDNPDGTVEPTHAALQLESGDWTSKLGPFEDISHKTLDAVNGPAYGHMICCMSRPRRKT